MPSLPAQMTHPVGAWYTRLSVQTAPTQMTHSVGAWYTRPICVGTPKKNKKKKRRSPPSSTHTDDPLRGCLVHQAICVGTPKKKNKKKKKPSLPAQMTHSVSAWYTRLSV